MDYKLNVVVPWNAAQAGGSIPLGIARYSNEPGTANVAQYTGLNFDRFLAHSIGGTVILENPAQLGAEIRRWNLVEPLRVPR